MEFLTEVRWLLLGAMAISIVLQWLLTGRWLPAILANGVVGYAVAVGALLGDAIKAAAS